MAFSIRKGIPGATERQRSLFERAVRIVDDLAHRIKARGGATASTATFNRILPASGITITATPQYFLDSGTTSIEIRRRGGKVVFQAEHRFIRFPKRNERNALMEVKTDTPGRWEQALTAAA